MLGVLGGTFDPVHFGHLRPALEVRQALGLREVRFVPLNVAVHRPQPEAAGEQRLAMVRAAIAVEPGFVADGRELTRPGSSYSYDTLLSLRRELGESEPICLLIGSDAFRDFLTWHRPDGILGLAHLVVMRRPDGEILEEPALRRWSEPRLCTRLEELASAPAGRIWFQRVTPLGISATAIRDLVAAGLSARYLLPDAVLDIVERDGLYRDEGRRPAVRRP